MAAVVAGATDDVTTHVRPLSRKLERELTSFRDSAHPRLAFVHALCWLLPDFWSGVVRARLYRRIGFDVDRHAAVLGNLDLPSGLPDFYGKLRIAAGAVVGTHVTMNLDAPVHLGRNVSIGPFVRIYTGTHQIGPGSNRRRPEVLARPVTIEDGSWVGLGAIVLPGVTIGRGSIVAAGAVVSQDVPANSYVEGNPAKVVRQLPFADR